MQAQCEVLVVDPSPGALVAAVLYARSGLSVRVLSDEPHPGGVGGFRFVRHRPPLHGLSGGFLLQQSLKSLKFHPHELQAIRKASPGLQVISSRHRLDIPSNADELAREIARELPQDASEIQRLLDLCLGSAQSFAAALELALEEAGQSGFLQTVGLRAPSWSPPLPPEDVPTWGEFLDQSDLSPEARMLLRALLRPFCALDVVDDLPLPVAGMHLAASLDGAYTDPSEEDALFSLLLRRVRAMRVDVQPNRVEEFLGGRRRIEAARLEGQDDPLPIQLLVTGGDPEDLLPWLPGNRRPYDRLLNRLAPSHFRYSIFLGVSAGVVPPDLAETAILVDDSDPEGDTGSLLVTTGPEDSPMAPAGFRAMTVSTLLPYSEDGGLPNDLDQIAGRMVDQVKWLMPYLERNLEILQVPVAEEADADNPIAIDARPVAYTPATPPGDDPVAAGLGVRLPHRNVFCAGPAAFPALGLGGQGLAGRLVERLGMANLKRPDAD